MRSLTRTEPNPVLLVLAFLAVYFIWGSTYLAIRFAIETIPPFLMGGIRFLTAGLLLYGVLRIRQEPAPTWAQWRSAAILGTLMLFIGNGCVVWAEQHISLSLAALLITTEPIWIVLLQWLAMGGEMPNPSIWLGVLMGTVGVMLLVGEGLFSQALQVDYAGIVAVVAATLAWAIGSLYITRAEMPDSPLQATSMQMLVGGALQLTLGTLRGEWALFSPEKISAMSWLSLGYLVVFGSIVAYTAYNWLARVAPPSRVATYAYINPVIAVFLGWLIGRETLTGQMLVAAALMILAVFVITTHTHRSH
ncbi:MAG: EamA family transporter [Chloroherpetonaceae bacterium]|nr:EamA family transporter [Chloroherpetonaceae bacterium]